MMRGFALLKRTTTKPQETSDNNKKCLSMNGPAPAVRKTSCAVKLARKVALQRLCKVQCSKVQDWVKHEQASQLADGDSAG